MTDDKYVGFGERQLRYLKQIGMDHLEWITDWGMDFRASPDYVLMLVDYGYDWPEIRLGQYDGSAFMEPDDIGWAGPVKGVRAYLAIEL